MQRPPMTVVETIRFLRDADGLLPESERGRLINFIAANPDAGNVIPETGGIRKLRWALAGGGKRGGAWVVYFFHNEKIPIFLLAVYGKNEKANLTREERNVMAKLAPMLVSGYLRSGGRKL